MSAKTSDDINLNLLKKLKPTAESKNFSSAAKKLSATSGTLSIQLNQLEAALGVKIFEKKGSHRTTQLTTEGKKIYELYSSLDEGLKSIVKGDKLRKEDSNKIKITTTSGLSNYIFPKLYNKRPDIFDKYFIESESSQNISTLKSSDFLIRADISHKEYVDIEKLFTLNFCFYASKSYINKFGQPAKLSELNKHRIISSQLLYYYDSFNDLPYKSPINSQSSRVFVSSDVSTLINLCKIGLGVTELPTNYPGTDELISFVLKDYNLTNKIYIAYNRDLKKEDYRLEFLDILKKELK